MTRIARPPSRPGFRDALMLADGVIRREIAAAQARARATELVRTAIRTAEDPRIIELDRGLPWKAVVIERGPRGTRGDLPAETDWACRPCPPITAASTTARISPSRGPALRAPSLRPPAASTAPSSATSAASWPSQRPRRRATDGAPGRRGLGPAAHGRRGSPWRSRITRTSPPPPRRTVAWITSITSPLRGNLPRRAVAVGGVVGTSTGLPPRRGRSGSVSSHGRRHRDHRAVGRDPYLHWGVVCGTKRDGTTGLEGTHRRRVRITGANLHGLQRLSCVTAAPNGSRPPDAAAVLRRAMHHLEIGEELHSHRSPSSDQHPMMLACAWRDGTQTSCGALSWLVPSRSSLGSPHGRIVQRARDVGVRNAV